jgi:hypothetical protein
MKRFLPAVAATLAISSASPAIEFDLGLGLFKKKPAGPTTPAKADTNTKAKQLVATLLSDMDIDRRKAAAEALRSHDPRNNPDIIPALVTSLQKDPSAAVRALSAETIGLYKSVNQSAAVALDAAEKGDPDAGVRAAAKNALWQYHLSGYRASSPPPATAGQTSEPPLAAPRANPTVIASKPPAPVSVATDFRPITQGISAGKPQTFQPTAEPPLAKPKNVVVPPPATVPDSVPPAPALPSRVEPPTLSIPSVPSGEPTIIPPPPVK